MRALVLILDDDVLAELVETLAHGAYDRTRMGHGPTEPLQEVIGRVLNEYSRQDGIAKSGDDGTVVKRAALPEVLDRAEAAAYAGRSTASIDRWRGLGLRAHKQGRSVRINRRDLEEYMRHAK